MEQGWVIVTTTDNLPQAEMIKSLLTDNEIISVILNKQSSSHLIGEIEVYVKNVDFLRAKQLILKQQEN
ncbi:MAG: hypothetical protein POELPBGB_02251 [Bacteroidia bacterium]|nr:hypothetical protein [Bacteroidia bacterium]